VKRAPKNRTTRPPIAVALALLCCAGLAAPNASRAIAPRVAHEIVPFAPGDRDPMPIVAQRATPPVQAPPAGLPDAIDYLGHRVAAPDADAAPRENENVLRAERGAFEPGDAAASALSPDEPLAPGTPDPSAPTVASALPGTPGTQPGAAPPAPPRHSDRPPEALRTREVRPDGDTSADPVLKYGSVFRPSIAPFKRFDVVDRVDADFLLRLRDSGLRAVPVGGAPDESRDRFFASVVVAATRGGLVPIPSVAPDARILRYETAPRRIVRFFRDGASNDFVRVEGDGLVRINFLTDAPRSYFGGELPRARLSDVPPWSRPALPPNVRAAAQRVLAQLRVDATAPVADALTTLVTHFRSYRAEEQRFAGPPAALFERLALGGLGACRHRAYTFVILAHALGLPARYVANEAHAFAEVWLPRGGWRRIDLGGVSPELVVYAAGERTLHQPGLDPFPRPGTYAQGYSAPATSMPERLSTATGAPDPSHAPSDPSTPSASGAAPPAAQSAAPATSPPDATTPTRIELRPVRGDLLRGDVLPIEGRAIAWDGRGAAQLRIEVSLQAADGSTRRDLAVLLTDDTGAFAAGVTLPGDLPPASYELVVETPGDARYARARAD
jgi:hypothetical protein